MASKVPVLRSIPGFNTIPSDVSTSNFRFYKLSNLVLTLGMLVHLTWIPLFSWYGAYPMAWLNIGSLAVYVFSISWNRKGYHFTSSIIMVLEILLHQLAAVRYFGSEAGFQAYVLVIGLFPFLMPKGRWGLKFLLLGACFGVYLFFIYLGEKTIPLFDLSNGQTEYLRVSNTLFAFISLAVSGGYYNIAMHQTEAQLEERSDELKKEKDKSDELLHNILPHEVAEDLKRNGQSEARQFDHSTVLFTDFVGFTSIAQSLSAKELVDEIHTYFKAFDEIIERHGLEKIKTIGDAYLAVSGLPHSDPEHAVKCVRAALDLVAFTEKKATTGGRFRIRIGLNSGNLVAGIVGVKKFAFDIWGDTVNTASRVETAGEAGKINISESTYLLIKDRFDCAYRGKISVKGKGEMAMYFVEKERI